MLPTGVITKGATVPVGGETCPDPIQGSIGVGGTIPFPPLVFEESDGPKPVVDKETVFALSGVV